MAILQSLRQFIVARDQFCCAYCQTTEDNCGQRMHVDHIYPESAGGSTVPHNLCAVCISCNTYKGALLRALDPMTGVEACFFILCSNAGQNILSGMKVKHIFSV